MYIHTYYDYEKCSIRKSRLRRTCFENILYGLSISVYIIFLLSRHNMYYQADSLLSCSEIFPRTESKSL